MTAGTRISTGRPTFAALNLMAQPTLFRGGKIFTIQPFSRKCPIGHALDIPFENWTSSLRIYTMPITPDYVTQPRQVQLIRDGDRLRGTHLRQFEVFQN